MSSARSLRVVIGSIVLASTLSSEVLAEKTKYPLTVENCGQTLTFQSAPERVVSVGQNSTETLYLLGLAHKVVGTSVWFGDVLPEFKETNKKIKRIADSIPGFESVVSEKPDFIANQFTWQIGKTGAVGKPEQFNELGIPVYTAPAECRKEGETQNLEMLYQEVEELARIFDVQERGETLVKELKQKEYDAIAKVKQSKQNANKDLSAVFWFSSADLEMAPYVAGRGYAADYIMKILGMKNVVDSDSKWPAVGWEGIAKSEPSHIVVGKMDRRRFAADDWQVKMEFLKNDPVTKHMEAVKNDHIVVIDAMSMDLSLRTFDGIAALADALAQVKTD